MFARLFERRTVFLRGPIEDDKADVVARIMIHQPLGGGRGTASDIQILAREFVHLRERMETILAERTGQPREKIATDTKRDFWMSAEEAVAYGLVDEVARRT